MAFVELVSSKASGVHCPVLNMLVMLLVTGFFGGIGMFVSTGPTTYRVEPLDMSIPENVDIMVRTNPL